MPARRRRSQECGEEYKLSASDTCLAELLRHIVIEAKKQRSPYGR
jgi:hypothetical protein